MVSGFSEDLAWRASLQEMMRYCHKMGWLSQDGLEFRAHAEWIS
jgi:hypothetical protein